MNEDSKVFDVSKPDRVRPDTTSRPVIVGHRPMVQDPMVSKPEQPTAAMDMEPGKETPAATEPKLDKADEHTGVTIQPEASAASLTQEPASEHTPPVPAAEVHTHETPVPPEHHGLAAAETPVHHPEAADAKPEPEADNPLANQALKSEQQQKAEAEAAAHNEAAQKLIENKQYNVVVGHFHHRKSSNKILFVIMALVLIGGAAAAYFMLAK